MSNYKLYSRLSDHETVLELWSSSTKYPDSIFFFSNFQPNKWWLEPEAQIMSWIFECASKLIFPYHAYRLAKWACDMYEDEEMRGWGYE